MNKKYLKVVLGFLIAALFVMPALTVQAAPEVRVVDLKVLGENALDEEVLLRLARMDRLEYLDLFPAIAKFGILAQSCSVDYPTTGLSFPARASESIALSGRIADSSAYRFASITDPADPMVSPVAAVVKPDGTVMLIDESMGVDIHGKSLTSKACILINPEDVVLVFADTAIPSGAPAAGPYGVDKEYNDNDDTRRELKEELHT